MAAPVSMATVDWASVDGDTDYLASLQWIDRHENLAVFGNWTSVAEEIVAAATCEALRRKRTARYMTASSLGFWLDAGEREGRRRQRLRRLAEFDLVALSAWPDHPEHLAVIRELLDLRRGRGATLLWLGPLFECLPPAHVRMAAHFSSSDRVTQISCRSRTVEDDTCVFAEDLFADG